MVLNNFKEITTDRLVLKWLGPDYAASVLHFLEDGRDVFKKYEAAKPPLFYSVKFQEHILKTEYDAALKGIYLRYYIFLREDPSTIIGTVSFGNVLPDPYVSCNIGYKLSPAYHSQGLGSEAVSAAIDACFSYLKMHRINAFVQTDNYPSIKLLEKCGFVLEGKCNKNLRVNGQWTDHLLYGLVN